MLDILLIAFGAVVGANARFLIYKELEKFKLSKNFIVVFINTFSSFLLGLILSISSKISSTIYAYEIGLIFSIGILGSLSTFSTFMYHLYKLFVQPKFYRALLFLVISLTSGILSFAVGYLLGM